MIIKDQPHVFVARAPIGLLKERGPHNKGQTHELTVFLLCNQRVDSEEQANEWLALLNSTVELSDQRDELVAVLQDATDYLKDPDNAKLDLAECLAELDAALEKARTA